MKTKKEIQARIKLFMSNIRRGLSYDANEVMLVDDIYKAITVTHCCKSDVTGSSVTEIKTQVEILKKVIDKLITFDDENDRMDYILDICNEYRKEAEKHYR